MHTGKAHRTTNIHSLKLNGTMDKIVAKLGTYKITKCNPKETNIAMSKYGLIHGGEVNKLESSDKAFKALNISMVTRTDKDNVDALALPSLK